MSDGMYGRGREDDENERARSRLIKYVLHISLPFHCHLLVPASKANPVIPGSSTSSTLQSTCRTMDQWAGCGSLTLTIYRIPSEPDKNPDVG